MKWYEQSFVNRRDYILENMDLLGLSAEEAVVVLQIDFMNEHRKPINDEILKAKTNMDSEKLDQVISLLAAKKYLEIRASSKGARFILNGLFETDIARNASIMDTSLFETFESEFGRPLSQSEMSKIAEWNRTTDKKMILYALREASVYRQLKINYIDKILSEWKTSGKTLTEIAGGD